MGGQNAWDQVPAPASQRSNYSSPSTFKLVKLFLLPLPDTQDPHNPSPLHPFPWPKTRPWPRPHFPPSPNLFIWKVGNLDYMDFSPFQLSYLRMCQTFLEAKHPAPPYKNLMNADVKTTELQLRQFLLVQTSLISTHV